MRRNIVHIGADELHYEIRNIVEVAREVALLSGQTIAWENIGDPVAKGEPIPAWIKDIVAQASQENSAYQYSPTRGLLETREFLAARTNALGGTEITPDDIIFFNGLGDAVNKVYSLLRREARIIGPSPAYPTHSSAEAAHAGSAHITYKLDPHNGWLPDLDELRNKVKYNENIAGILIINPDNPTGAVFPRDVISEMVAIARDYDLFILADEIYINMVFGPAREQHASLAEVIGETPAISLKGISKEIPWPGARCGWAEFYNQHGHPIFQKYCQSLLSAKMLEVCSTTLPQLVIPRIMAHPDYAEWQSERNAFYRRRSEQIKEIFARCDGVTVNIPDGAFYLSVVFDKAARPDASLEIKNSAIRQYIHDLLPHGSPADKRFVYQLLGAHGICVVPLSSFVTKLAGFRSTLLERDDDRFLWIYNTIADAINRFLS
ncbi:MAG: pyridoxal phosphate-dependent aminotransferase [Leptospiraceae bacterium]|nr:pyridoxal phosphate-dependent aminotransferase [Leptospiraceae bacterium]